MKPLKRYKPARKIRACLPSWLSAHYRTYRQIRLFLADTEHWSREKTVEWQFHRLKWLINQAWDHVPGYRKYWDENGFEPSMLRSLDDLALVPMITREHIISNAEKFVHKQLKGKEVVTTGGSTGIPFAFYQQKKNGLIEKAFIHHLWSSFFPSVDLKTKATILRGKIIHKSADTDPILGLILSSYHLTKDDMTSFVKAIDKQRTPILHAYPSSLYVFTRMMEHYSLYPRHQFKAIMLGSEILHPYQKELFNKIFRTPVCHWYGHAEKTILAGNHPDNNDLTSNPFYGITEIIRYDGQPANPGYRGELVGTGFWNVATPFIRYRTMDYGTAGPQETDLTPGGKRVIERIDGRIQELVVGYSGTLLPLTALSIVCGNLKGIKQFRFYQSVEGELQFCYIPISQVCRVDEERLRQELLRILKEDYSLNIKEVSSLEPTSAGKWRYLVQNLDIKKYLG